MSRICASISSRGTAPSGLPRENANPAEVVASALNPRRSRYFAVPMSHGFGSTKQPDSCSARNFAARDVWLDVILEDYAAPARARFFAIAIGGQEPPAYVHFGRRATQRAPTLEVNPALISRSAVAGP